MRHRIGIAVACMITFASLVSAEPADQSALDQAFIDRLTGATLVGNFTITGMPIETGPRPDKYTITKVSREDERNWLFIAKVEYERGTFPVALKIPVLWAGTTAVISVTDMEIPLVGKGVFHAKVLIDGDRYAGTWGHDNVGGHMFGMIEKPKPAKEAEE